MSFFACDPREVQRVKDALQYNDVNLGVGIVHEPTGQIRLSPFDDLPRRGGHVELADALGLPLAECKGFIIARQGDSFMPVNMSHLNGPQGQPGSLQMPAATFAGVVRALLGAGL